ncbi:MAG: type II toxin-antitoxin system VapC family toxin [Gammaproteobacteria bacterium]|nr:type II toxin-antitoxin system VapC family toxin [Gammaproteobacteria bacterium]
MLDTNVVCDLVRQPNGSVGGRVTALEQGSFSISVIVAAELQYSAARSRSSRFRKQLDAVLSAIETVPLDEPVDTHYGTIRSELERIGRPIGQNDLLIAAHARALGGTLVTNNTREFGRVPDLDIEDWR